MLSAKSGSAVSAEGRDLGLDLRTLDLVNNSCRHLVRLAHDARGAGSRLVLRCDRLILSEIASKAFGRRLLEHAWVSWRPRREPFSAGTFVLTDHGPPPAGDGVRLLVGRDVEPGSAVMPFPLHPNSYDHATDEALAAWRQTSPRRGIFFAGNQRAKYQNHSIERDYGVMSRPRILRLLRDRYAARIRPTLNHAESRSSIVLQDSSAAKIENAQWLPTVARAEFFLCLPGLRQPLCHNLVEAMCVGTIPIVEYGDRLHPALRDSVEAICFRGEAGLIEAIERVDRMTAEEVEGLRRGAMDYYQRSLRGDRFLAALRDGRLAPPTRSVSMPFHPKNLYLRDYRRHVA